MYRKELVQKLQDSSAEDFRSRGSGNLLSLFIWYFSDVVQDEYEYTSILHSLPGYVADAIEIFSRGEALPDHIVDSRAQYLEDVGKDNIPLLTTIGYGGVQRILLISQISDMMKAVTGYESVREQIRAYCLAEDTVLTQAFYRFFKQVGEKGLLDIYDTSSCGCSGMFGQTDLRIFQSAGRIMITFARRKEGKTVYKAEEKGADLELPYIEEQITFIGDSSRRDSPIWGIQSCYASFRLALDMIEQVIHDWPENVNDQKAIFKSNANVGIGV